MNPGARDGIVVQKVLAGDAEAFRELLERYRKPVLSFIYNRIGRTDSREQVEDLGQEVFLKAFHGLSGFDRERGTAFSTWLFTIARNACIDFRRKGHHAETADEARMLEAEDLSAGTGSGHETRRLLERALAGLPDEQRMAVEWVFVQGMSYDEAAQMENVSVGTLASRLARAKEKLQRSLGGAEREGGDHG